MRMPCANIHFGILHYILFVLQRQQCGYLGISQFDCNGIVSIPLLDWSCPYDWVFLSLQGCCYDKSSSSSLPQKCYYTTLSYRDLYFFGHGHGMTLSIVHKALFFVKLKKLYLDYKRALKEYSLVGGQIPLPPRYAFGVFYSRYWAYNDVGEMVIPVISGVPILFLIDH